MLAILSPAKKQDFTTTPPFSKHTSIQCKKDTAVLASIMHDMSATQLAKLMSLSKKLAELNYQRYQDYHPTRYTTTNAKPAIYAFQGDVYVGLQANTLTEKDIEFAQNHVSILSGLYGILRPLDLIQAHRLEMGTALKNPQGANLYAFWQPKLLTVLHKMLANSGSNILLNLASNEYFKAIDTNTLNADIIDVDFKENKSGQYKTIGIHAKRARGKMANFIIKQRVKTPAGIKKFNVDGYVFNKQLSSDKKLVFTR